MELLYNTYLQFVCVWCVCVCAFFGCVEEKTKTTKRMQKNIIKKMQQTCKLRCCCCFVDRDPQPRSSAAAIVCLLLACSLASSSLPSHAYAVERQQQQHRLCSASANVLPSKSVLYLYDFVYVQYVLTYIGLVLFLVNQQGSGGYFSLRKGQ